MHTRRFTLLAIVLGAATAAVAPACSSPSDEDVSCRSSFAETTGTLQGGGSSQVVLNTPDAKKTCHAKMRIEFRWAADAKSRDKSQPMPKVALAFNAGGGTFGPGPGPYTRDDTSGVRWWWSEVEQGDKNNPNPTTFFQTSVVPIGAQDPIFVQMGIYYTPAR